MAYIWENYSEIMRFHVGDRISPYLEIASPDSAGGGVNPLLRFACIFGHLAELQEQDKELVLQEDSLESVHDIENILFHYLANLDLLSGHCRKQIRVNALEKEMLAGSFGRPCAEHWQKLTAHDKRVILYTLAEQYESETIDHWFFKAAQKLWEYVSILYEPATELYYVYIYARETPYAAALLEVIVHLFWDIRCRLQIIWYYPYGLIGEDYTMRISEVQIV